MSGDLRFERDLKPLFRGESSGDDAVGLELRCPSPRALPDLRCGLSSVRAGVSSARRLAQLTNRKGVV